MDYNTLLDMAAELGYRLAISGAETFRVEESINLVLESYGIHGEVFAIPNCLHVSIETAEGKPMTRMRRIGHHGNNLDAVEKYNSVSRRICSEHPAPDVAANWINDTTKLVRFYPLPMSLLGNFLIALGFAVLFGGTIRDSLCAGICGIAAGLVTWFMERLKVNPFFSIITASFVMSTLGYCCGILGLANSGSMTVTGTLMVLVPGLLFTNAMRDIIYGDTNSGINRIVQVFLIAVAIALGTGAALKLTSSLWSAPASVSPIEYSLPVELIVVFIGSLGFTISFNIQLPGGFLCVIGGVLGWLTYRIIGRIGGDISAYLIASLAASLYSECMARIRKYPAISYLVTSLIAMIPGAGVYYTMNFIVQGEVQKAVDQGVYTIAIAGALAVGILLISTIFRIIYTQKKKKSASG